MAHKIFHKPFLQMFQVYRVLKAPVNSPHNLLEWDIVCNISCNLTHLGITSTVVIHPKLCRVMWNSGLNIHVPSSILSQYVNLDFHIITHLNI